MVIRLEFLSYFYLDIKYDLCKKGLSKFYAYESQHEKTSEDKLLIHVGDIISLGTIMMVVS